MSTPMNPGKTRSEQPRLSLISLETIWYTLSMPRIPGPETEAGLENFLARVYHSAVVFRHHQEEPTEEEKQKIARKILELMNRCPNDTEAQKRAFNEWRHKVGMP